MNVKADACQGIEVKDAVISWKDAVWIVITVFGLGVSWAILPQTIQKDADNRYLSKEVGAIMIDKINSIDEKVDKLILNAGIK